MDVDKIGKLLVNYQILAIIRFIEVPPYKKMMYYVHWYWFKNNKILEKLAGRTQQ